VLVNNPGKAASLDAVRTSIERKVYDNYLKAIKKKLGAI